MINNGQFDAARDMIEEVVGPDVASKMRWDLDDITDQIFAETQRTAEKVLLDGKQSWVGAALGKFRDQLDYFTTMTQKAYQNPDIGGLQRFKLAMDWMHSINSKVAAEATRVAEAWTKMGKERRAVMERVIKEEYKNGEHWTDMQEVNGTLRHVAGERLAKELADRHISLDDGQLQLYLDQKNQYLSRLNTQQAMQRTMINKRYAGRPGLIRSRTQALEQVYQSVRERPFMASQTRFGEHGLRGPLGGWASELYAQNSLRPK